MSDLVLISQSFLLLQISTLQSQIHSQESDLQSQEEELSRAKADLGRLQQEETQLEQSLAAGKIQLETIIKSLKATQDEINQVLNLSLVCMCVWKYVNRGHCCTASLTFHCHRCEYLVYQQYLRTSNTTCSCVCAFVCFSLTQQPWCPLFSLSWKRWMLLCRLYFD